MLIRSVLFNFQGAFLNSVFLISQTTLLLYHIFSNLSRGFSKVFLKFSWFSFVPMWSRKFRLLGFTSFSIISYLFKFVKRFLKFIFWTAFQAFKIWFNSLSLLSKQLIYYITLFSICQEVFQTFLKFFLDFQSLCDVFKPFSRQLLYYTLFVRKSQPLFQKYLKKFCTISFPSFTQNIRFRIHKITKDPPRQVFSMIMHSPGVQIWSWRNRQHRWSPYTRKRIWYTPRRL